MGKYETTNIRNLGIVGQGGAGKTSLTEAILFNTVITSYSIHYTKLYDAPSILEHPRSHIEWQKTSSGLDLPSTTKRPCSSGQ